KYSMRVWIDSRAENEVMGKKFNAKLRVEACQVTTKVKSSEVKYYNKNSVTKAETVEDALDELFDRIGNGDA
ncbi:MAG: hypothetical protein Q4E39_07215, partial [bacterium]|nr:hypothetical protein [bacterium]